MTQQFIKRICLIICIANVANGSNTAGIGSFLNRGMSARSIGMGSSFTAVAGDPSAVFWNPAGLLNKSGFMFQLGDVQDVFINSFGDINNPQIAFSYNSGKPLLGRFYWAIGAGSHGFLVKQIDEYDENSNFLGQFNSGEAAYFGSMAVRAGIIRMGFTWKYIEQRMSSSTPFFQSNRTSFSGKPHDIGIQIKPFKFLTVGVVVRDSILVGTQDIYEKNIQTGIALKLKDIGGNSFDFIISADQHSFDFGMKKLNSGLECTYHYSNSMAFSGRMGLSGWVVSVPNNDTDLDKINEVNRKFSLGFGVKYKTFQLDGSWVQDFMENPYTKFYVFTFSWGV